MLVWARQGALPGIEEEHRATGDDFCAVQPVDDVQKIDGVAAMTVSENSAEALQTGKTPSSALQKS